jgi:hypothetical protein
MALCAYAYAQHDSGQDASLAPAITVNEQGRSPGEFGVEIPAGIMFGKFEKESGPFLITGSIIVPSGQSLEFGPGCKVYIGGNYSTITVFGQLIAKGTADDPVIFQSAKVKPNPWDWDRIYCRSRNRSIFEHCVIRHSNYGICVENGSVSIDHCLFERNSLHGLVVRNSSVILNNTTFTKGHVLAVFCQEGAQVQAESLTVTDNITGLACTEKSDFSLKGGSISRNTNGLAVLKGSSVSILAADITQNRIGLVSQMQIPKKVSEMVFANALDIKLVDVKEMEDLLKPPEAVKSIVLPKASAEAIVKEDFKAGFSAVRAPKEATSSFIGNVTAGFKLFMPKSQSVRDTFALQSRYPGEDAPGLIDKIQPEVQVFASGKNGDANVNLNIDAYGNQWTGLRRNMTSLSINYSDQSVVLGDFYENYSETSINGRKLTGLKFNGNYVEMGRGVKQVTIEAAFGQSEMPKEMGGHELDLYNQIVDTGMSIRQQITYVAAISYKPSLISVVNVKGIIARDQGYNTLFGKVIEDPKAPGLVEAQTGCIDGKIDLLGGKLSLLAEVDMGHHDTLTDTTHSEEIPKIAWWDPQAPEAVSRVFGVIPKNKNYATSLGAIGILSGYNLNANFTQIAPEYFSAGNPYLEIDRRTITLSGDKEFSPRLSGNFNYEYQRRTIHSPSPTDNHCLMLNTKHVLGAKLPEINFGYTLNFESSTNSENARFIRTDINGDTLPDSSMSVTYSTRDMKNLFSLQSKQQFASGIDYSLRYQLLWEDDFSKYVNPEDMRKRSGMQHQVSAWLGFKAGKLLRNKLTARVAKIDRVQDSLNGLSYKFSDDARFTLIPRKLSLNVKGEYSKRVDNKFNTTINARRDETTQTTGVEAEVKYSFTSRMSANALGRYEQNYDTETITDNYKIPIVGLHVTYLF